MEKFVNLAKILIILSASIIVVCCLTYNYNTGAVSEDDSVKTFTVEENETFLTLATSLKEQNLIRSEFFYKIYIKLNNVTDLKAGIYDLTETMDVKEIVDLLTTGSSKNENNISVTFREGINMRKVMSIITENTDITEKEITDKLSDSTYLDELINKYWFLTDDIKNKDIYYSLEGYLYPNTYELDKTWDIEKVFEVMLNETDKKLTPYKYSFETSDYSIHEILTLASIVELEGANSDDRNGIAGVFMNRLEDNWALGSDVTTYYAVGIDFNERDLYMSEINDYNAYNTRSNKMAGKLPVSPICNPSINSIDAVLKPTEHKYYYFVADKNKKTYFTKTSSEHNATISKLKKDNLWYTYS